MDYAVSEGLERANKKLELARQPTVTESLMAAAGRMSSPGRPQKESGRGHEGSAPTRRRPVTNPPTPDRLVLLCNGYDMDPAVLLPAGLAFILTNGLFLAVADHAKLLSGNPYLHQVGLGCLGTRFAEGHVVLGRAALVAVAFDGEFVVRIILQNVAQFRRIAFQRLDRIGTQ